MNVLTPRQLLLADHVLDLAAEAVSAEYEVVANADHETPLVAHFQMDSLDVVEFIMACEERWPGLEILEDEEVEEIIYKGSSVTVARWLEGLLVKQFGPEWAPEPVVKTEAVPFSRD